MTRKRSANGSSSQDQTDNDSLEPFPKGMNSWIAFLGVVLAMLVGLFLGQLRELWVELQGGADRTGVHYQDGRGVARLDFRDEDAAPLIASFVDRNEPFVCRSCITLNHHWWWDHDENLIEAIGPETFMPIRMTERRNNDDPLPTEFRRTDAPREGGGSAYEERQMSAKEFFGSYSTETSDEHLYAAQVDVATSLPGLLPFIQSSAPPSHVLDAVGPIPPASHHPVTMYFGKGPLTTQTHYDSLENLVCVVSGGTKTFQLFDPATSSKFLYIDRSKFGNASPVVTPRDWQDFPMAKYAIPIGIQLHPGDCLYLPVYWYHSVTSSADRTISINWWRGPNPQKMHVLENVFCNRNDFGAGAKCDG